MAETVKLDLTGMLERFRFLGDMLAPTVYTAMLVSAKQMLRDVVAKRMSNPRRGSTAKNLGVDTGTARRSMIDSAGFDAKHVFALIGSPVDYVKAHEEGFHGVQHVRGYTRHLARLQRNTKTGRVSKSSARIYKARLGKGGVTSTFVRPHGRKVDIIAKHFIRDTVIESKLPTENRIINAIAYAAKTGRLPSASQLGA